jgi:hypothetical protein
MQRDGLDCLGRLEVASVSLGVGHLVGEVLQADEEGLGLNESLGVLHTLDVTLVNVAISGADGDDTPRARHLEVEVCITRDGHEPGVAWPSQDGVVGSSESYYLKREGFLPEVGGGSEADRQVDLAERLDPLTGSYAVERSSASLDLGLIDPQKTQSLGVDDVEAATAVHEDFGEPGVANDGVDDQRVLSEAQNVAGVVALVEGDGLVGPVQVDRRRHLDREDLPTLLLPLPCREVRRWPTEDHEAIVDLRELLTPAVAFATGILFLAVVCQGALPVEVAPKHVVEYVGTPEGTSGIPTVCRSDQIRLEGVSLLLLGFPLLALSRVALGSCLGDLLLLLPPALVLGKDGLDGLLSRGKLCGYVHQLAGPCGGLATQLAYQLSASSASEECLDDVRVRDAGQLGALLGEASDVLA